MESTGSRDDLQNGQVPFKMRSFLLDDTYSHAIAINKLFIVYRSTYLLINIRREVNKK